MYKKLLTILSVLMVLAVFLGACQPAPEATEAPEPTEEVVEATEEVMEEPTEEVMEEPTEEEAEPTEEAMEPVATLRVWADQTRSVILSELADDFLAAYNVEVIVEEVANLRDDFTIAAPVGEGPDILAGIPHDQTGALIASGLITPIDLGDKASLFLPSAIDSATVDGVLYGMPFQIENLGFFYNTELVETPPATWDEVVSIGNDLIASGTTTYGLSLSGTTYDAYPLMTAFGGYIFGQDDAGNWVVDDLGVGSQGMIDAVQWLQDRVNEGFTSESTDWDTAHVLFETGESPFLMAGPWALDRLRASGVPYGIAPFPGGGYPFAGTQVFVVNAFSENALLAQAFLTEFVATEEVMAQLAAATNRSSAYIPVLDATSDADLLALSQIGETAQPMPNIPEMGSVWGNWSDGVTLAMQNQQTAEDAMTDASKKIQSLLSGAAAGMVNVPGSYQSLAGCDGDWQPDCEATAMTEGEDGLYTSTADLPAGDYEAKVALDGGWTINYGVDGVADGDNYQFTVTADGTVTFTYDPATNVLTIDAP